MFKRIFFGCLFISFLVLGAAYVNSAVKPLSLKVKLLSPIVMEETSDTGSALVQVTQEAAKFGLTDTQFLGSLKYNKQENEMVRGYIDWHSIKLSQGSADVTQPLNESLKSQFLTDDKRLEPGTILTMTGNLQALTDALNTLNTKVEDQRKDEDISTSSEQSKTSQYRPSGSVGGTSSSSPTGADTSSIESIAAEVIVTSIEICEPLVDQEEGKVYLQHRIIEATESGQELSRGSCENTGEFIQIQQEQCGTERDLETLLEYRKWTYFYYQDGSTIPVQSCLTDYDVSTDIPLHTRACPDVIDTVNRVKYSQFETYAVVDSIEVQVEVCSIDEGTAIEFNATRQECGNEYDLEALEEYTKFEEFALIDGVRYDLAVCAADYSNGTALPVTRTYGAPCSLIPDWANGTVWQQYRETTTIQGVPVEVTACRNDFTDGFPIEKTFDGCDLRHDFAQNKTFELERFFYVDNSTQINYLTMCQDSPVSYDYFSTRNTCSPVIDEGLGLVFIQERTGYANTRSGLEEYVTDCAPIDAGLTFLREDCDPLYDHDVLSGVSYFLERLYYEDGGNTVNITTCGTRSETTYAHQFDQASCPPRYDDGNKQMYWQAMTWIDTPGGRVDVTGCQDFGAAQDYVYQGVENGSNTFTSSTSWAVPEGVVSVNAFLVGGGGSGGAGGYRSSTSGQYWMSGQNSPAGCSGGSGSATTGPGGGGGGGAGQVKTQAVSVSPGTSMSVTVGGSNGASSFGSASAAAGSAGGCTNGQSGWAGGSPPNHAGAGGAGGSGWGSSPSGGGGTSGSGQSSVMDCLTGGAGGAGGGGYGSGGGGAGGDCSMWDNSRAGGAGARGYIKVDWTRRSWLRPDLTNYYAQ